MALVGCEWGVGDVYASPGGIECDGQDPMVCGILMWELYAAVWEELLVGFTTRWEEEGVERKIYQPFREVG